MDDQEWIKSLDHIQTPEEALRVIVENERFLGYDPYYKDLRKAMIEMAERILS